MYWRLTLLIFSTIVLTSCGQVAGENGGTKSFGSDATYRLLDFSSGSHEVTWTVSNGHLIASTYVKGVGSTFSTPWANCWGIETPAFSARVKDAVAQSVLCTAVKDHDVNGYSHNGVPATFSLKKGMSFAYSNGGPDVRSPTIYRIQQ